MDEKWLWVEHRFVVSNRCVAAGVAKLLISNARDFIAGLPKESPDIAKLLALEQLFGRDD
jgi:hypothetical protein